MSNYESQAEQEFYEKHAERIADRLSGPDKGDPVADYRGYPIVQWAIIAEELTELANSSGSMETNTRECQPIPADEEIVAIKRLAVEAKAHARWIWWPEERPQLKPHTRPSEIGKLALA
ncbi:MAG TPA: hypothetical protein VFN51_03555 [Candidatus Saccharimonadales bacterium]|nr:hypothetical protein [Candidatus Saccharimonadales bacterium]